MRKLPESGTRLKAKTPGYRRGCASFDVSDSEKDVVGRDDAAEGRKIVIQVSPAAEKLALFRSLFPPPLEQY
jgi:hypothetical protein